VLCPSLCVKGWKYKDYKSRLRPWFRKFKEVGGERGKKGGRERDRKRERERERERLRSKGPSNHNAIKAPKERNLRVLGQRRLYKVGQRVSGASGGSDE
jgi:hypothetical protein